MKKRFSRVTATLAALILLIVFASPVFATTDTGELSFELSASASSVKVGNTVEVNITLKNTTAFEITDLNFRFDYDNTKFGVYQEAGSTTPDWVLSHAATTLTTSGSSLVINYSATDRTTNKPIGANESFSVAIKMYAPAGSVSDVNSVFAISNASALMRTDVTSNVASESNLSHTFTFKTNYPSTTVTITALSSNANLTSLVPMVNNTEKDMTPAFSPDVLQYRVVVLYEFPGIDFTITKADSKATAELVSPTNNVYEVGDNTVQIVVTAENGQTKKTYTIIIQRLDVGQTIPPAGTTSSTVSGSDVTSSSTTTSSTTAPSDEQDVSGGDAGTIIKEGGLETTISLNLATLLALVFAEIAMFLLAFYSGYLTHKNAIKPDKLSLDDIVAAQEQLAAQDDMPSAAESDASIPADYQPEGDMAYAEQYPDQYAGQYPDQYAETYPGEYGQGYPPDYVPVAEFGPQAAFDDGLTQEYVPDAPAAPEPEDQEEYDEYGYNAHGESNYQQGGPSSSIYYS